MQLTTSKNSFRVLGFLIVYPLIIVPYLAFYSLGLPWWANILFWLAFAEGLRRLEKKSVLFGVIIDPSRAESLRIGPISVNLPPPPSYTRKRQAVVCCAFLAWFSAVIVSIFRFPDRPVVLVSLLVLGVVSAHLMLNFLELRWLAQDRGQSIQDNVVAS